MRRLSTFLARYAHSRAVADLAAYQAIPAGAGWSVHVACAYQRREQAAALRLARLLAAEPLTLGQFLARAFRWLRVAIACTLAAAFVGAVALAFYAVGVQRWEACGGAVETAFVFAALCVLIAPRAPRAY